jgi:type I restriction enzyme, S subunit
MRLKHLCIDAGQYGLNISAQDYVPSGHRLIRTSDIDETGRLRSRDQAVFVEVPLNARYELRDGDLLLSRSGTVGRALLLGKLEEPATYAGYLVRFRPLASTEPRFMAYLAASNGFQAAISSDAVTSTIQNFNAERYANIPVTVPSLAEQRRIADFLDAETTRIDALMSCRTSQMAVLEEVELARIGEHFSTAETIGPVYAYYDVQLGKMLNPERASGDSQQPYLRHANIHWYEINTEDLATMTFEPHERRRYSIQAGDLLINEGGAGGTAEAAVWDGRISTCFYQKSLHRARARSHLPVEWLMYWLRFAKASGIFDTDNNKATIPHLTGEQLAESRIPIPEDGHRHVAELASEIAAIRETQRKIASANTLLAERRRALITAAVTGVITV